MQKIGISGKLITSCLISTLVLVACKKGEPFDMADSQPKLISSKAQVLSSDLCAILYLTNNVTAQVYQSGTINENTGGTESMTLANPTMTYNLYNGDAGHTLVASGATASVGSNIAYNKTGEMDVHFAGTVAPSSLSNPFIRGSMTLNGAGAGAIGGSPYTIDISNGEGSCGYIYFYNVRNVNLGQTKPRQLNRMIAGSGIALGHTVFRYNIADDLRKQFGYASEQKIQERLKAIKGMIRSLSGKSESDLAIEADTLSVVSEGLQKSETTWTEATIRVVARQRLKAINIESETLIDAVAGYVKQISE